MSEPIKTGIDDWALRVTDLWVERGGIPVLRGCDLEVRVGELVCVFGHNGAGKTTLLRLLAGAIQKKSGSVETVGGKREALRTALVPDSGGVFPTCTVAENLGVAMFRKSRDHREERLRSVFTLFPILEEKYKARAGDLSGGQRQMLKVGMAIARKPDLYLCDEPTIGLAPRVQDSLVEGLRRLCQEGSCVLVAEQNVAAIRGRMDRWYVLQRGRIVREGMGGQIESSELWGAL